MKEKIKEGQEDSNDIVALSFLVRKCFKARFTKYVVIFQTVGLKFNSLPPPFCASHDMPCIEIQSCRYVQTV